MSDNGNQAYESSPGLEYNARVAPKDLKAEQAVIGATLVSDVALDALAGKVKETDFYNETHRVIWRAIKNVHGRREPVDSLTVAAQLKRDDEFDRVGGRNYVFRLMESVPTAANASQYAEIIKNKAMLRDAIDLSDRISQYAYQQPEDATVVFDEAEKLILEITGRNDGDTKGLVHANELLAGVLESLINKKNNDGLIGVPSGFRDLDKVTGGFQKEDLIILAARPSMGKTALALNAIMAAAKADEPVAVFTLEMSSEDLLERTLSAATGVNLSALRQGLQTEEEMAKLVPEVSHQASLEIHIDDDASITVTKIHSRLRRLQSMLRKKGKKLGLVVIDYLQLMVSEGKYDNRNAELATITRALKIIAKELEVPVIVLSQLSRGVEGRGDKRPMLADLRDSGSIEQDADVVMFIYRDEYYDPDSEAKGEAEIIIRKHRNGPTGMVKLAWLQSIASFKPIAQAHHQMQAAQEADYDDTDPRSW